MIWNERLIKNKKTAVFLKHIFLHKCQCVLKREEYMIIRPNDPAARLIYFNFNRNKIMVDKDIGQYLVDKYDGKIYVVDDSGETTKIKDDLDDIIRNNLATLLKEHYILAETKNIFEDRVYTGTAEVIRERIRDLRLKGVVVETGEDGEEDEG